MTCLWGLMQKIRFFFSRDRAKLVPMDKVAGRAGGTTIVIKSRARTTIKFHASYWTSAPDGTRAFQQSHVKPNKVHNGGSEANRSNASHNGYIPKGVLVEFET